MGCLVEYPAYRIRATGVLDMKRKNRLVLKIEGPGRNDHHLDLSVFADKTRQFLRLLKSNAQEIDAKDMVFPMVSLSHSSPVTMECVPQSRHPMFAEADDARYIKNFAQNLSYVRENEAHRLSNLTLSCLEKLAKVDAGKIASSEIQIINDELVAPHVYELDSRFQENLANAHKAGETVVSTIDGRLERINIHGANTFTIYSSLPNKPAVACKFRKELLKNVQGALGNFVSVWGKCFYRSDTMFPYKIDVQGMEVLPPSGELPSLNDLRGIAPDATRGESSEQFVRKLRDQWDKHTNEK